MWAWEKDKKIKNEWNYLNLKNGRPQIYETFLSNIKYHWAVFILTLLIVFYLYRINKKNYAFVLLSTTFLHFFFGKYGFFSRYEVYYIIFFEPLLEKQKWKGENINLLF